MKKSLLHRVLEGNEEAIAMFGEADNCAVIDWKAGPLDIVEAIADFLPDGYLTLGRVTATSCELMVTGKRPFCAQILSRATQENLLLSINQAVQPEYELRQFRPSYGDGYSLYVAPRSVWSEIERSNPEASESLFLSAPRLAAYWSKSYLVRMFSKP
ncbi:hypothetical protein [Pseudoxanthomonas sp. PXM02]|uniref:hypothetical protein n=1 Tax=Pseudoxanthomonas sp. PXM02 TaxID=2769294 RepID=UPI001781F2A3|nr:hypothetical protein [Pseudoxanthomonas sp. PXM02]MBD9480575.1 hypothetical protein [Pseudoxanthomonas sp. PXM02]